MILVLIVGGSIPRNSFVWSWPNIFECFTPIPREMVDWGASFPGWGYPQNSQTVNWWVIPPQFCFSQFVAPLVGIHHRSLYFAKSTHEQHPLYNWLLIYWSWKLPDQHGRSGDWPDFTGCFSILGFDLYPHGQAPPRERWSGKESWHHNLRWWCLQVCPLHGLGVLSQLAAWDSLWRPAFAPRFSTWRLGAC